MSGGPDLDDILAPYHLSKNQLEKIIGKYLDEFQIGLEKGPPVSTLAMLPSFIPELPNGTENGRFLGLDLGGTGVRTVLVEISPGSPLNVVSSSCLVPDQVMKGTGEGLFDFCAKKLKEFLTENSLENEHLSLGFVFSFPCDQVSLTESRLLWWTKEYDCSGTIGENVVQMLQNAIDRNGGMKVGVRAIMNDTVGQLLAGAYEHGQECTIGVVLGTGCNAAYLEETKNIKKLNSKEAGYEFPNMIIDTEWQQFGCNGQLDFIQTPLDRAVDLFSLRKGEGIQDKHVAGMHAGERVRRLILEAEKSGACGVENEILAEIFKEKNCMTCKDVSDVLRDDPRAAEFRFTREFLQKIGYRDPTLDVCVAVGRVCYVICDRSAGILAAAIAALIRRMTENGVKGKVKIGMGGAVIEKHSMFQRLLKQWLSRVLPLSTEWELVITHDGSGKGAALAAAVAQRLQL